MSKVIKILVRTLIIVFLTVLGLLMAVALALNVPAFQNFVVHKAAAFASEKLGTKVTIGSVKLKLISRAEIEEIYVEDLHGDTLAYIRRLDASIRDIGLSGGPVMLGDVTLEGTRFYMRQVPLDLPDTTTSNLGELLARLRSDKPKKEKKGGFELRAASVTIDDLAYRYRKLEPEPRDYGVNFQDVGIERLDLRAQDLQVIGDSIVLRADHISIKDKSGFAVDEMSATHLSVSNAGIRMERMHFRTPDTEVDMNYLRLISDSWKSFGYFVDSVRIEADINPSRISYATVAYFAPGLRDWKSVYEDVTGRIEGTVADLGGEITRLKTLDTRLDGVRFALKGLPDVPNTNFNISIGGLHTSADDALWLMKDITRNELPENTAAILRRLGELSFTGRFNGLLSRFTAEGDLNTSRGSAEVDLAFTPQKGGLTAFAGHLDVEGADLGTVLQSASLGRASVRGRVDGHMGGPEGISVEGDLTLARLDFNDYQYRDVGLKGHFENRHFRGTASSADPNIAFDFNGELDFADSLPRYDFRMRLHRADLHKLNFNKRDTISVLSCLITARASGNNPDNVNGQVDIDSLVYACPADTVRTDRVTLKGVNNPSVKLLSLQSSFADVTFSSRLGYANLGQYLTEALHTYIPTLNTNRKGRAREPHTAANPGDYYLLKMKVKQANNLSQALMPGLILAQGTELSFMLNPVSQNISLSLQSEYLEWNRYFVSDINLTGRNQGDSLSLFVRATDCYASGFYMPEFSVVGGCKDDKVSLAARFNDREHGVSAIVNSAAQFTTAASGISQVRLRLGQSYITNRDQTWRLSSGEIVYDTTRVSIERLRIVSSNGELVAQGVASRSRQDTLHVTLSNFNLQPFTQFTQRMGYNITGITNGYADMISVMKGGMLSSDIRFDSMRVNQVAVAPLLFNARWDFQNERARVLLTNRAKGDTLARVFYSPKDKRYMGQVRMPGVDLSLIDPLLQGVLRGSKGTADINLDISSRAGDPVFKGSVRIPSLTTTVDFTNVAYTLKDARVAVEDNVFRLAGARLTDPGGNTADLDATFALGQGFSTYNYTIGLKPRNLLALSTTAQQNDLFNGKVYASGAVTIKGDKRGVSMDIAATTSANSTFQMSLSSKSGFGDADFITFVNPRAVRADSSWYQQRKRQIIAGEGEQKRAENASTLAIDMALTVLPNTEFGLVIDPSMGKGITARGNGALNISVNPKNGDFRMYGDYELTEGSYNLVLERLVNKTLQIQPGSVIKWTGDPADALLDVTAVYKLKPSLGPLVGQDSPYASTDVSTECKIILRDRLLKPNISFAVDVTDAVPEIQNVVANAMNTPELMSTQFLYLVAFNSFYSDNTSNSNIGSMANASTAYDFLFSQVSNMISSDKVNIGINYRPGDEKSSDEVSVKVSTSFSKRVFLDVEGNYDTESNPAAASSGGLTGDFAVRYLIDETGNFQGKFFSRTINTYDENQGLQETGMGVYYHEDFNSLRDIGRNIRARFRRDKDKKAQKEAAREQRKQMRQDTTINSKTNNN